MRRLFKLIAGILMLAVLTGCWDQNIYEDIGIVLSLGLDKGSSDNGVLVTAALPIVIDSESSGSGKEEGTDKNKVDIIAAESNLLRETRELQRLTSAKQLESGKIQNVLFGSELAKERKISEYLSLFERDTQSTVQATVIIVDGSANELLSKGAKFTGKPRISIYINDLLKRNYKQGYCPQVNVVRYNILNFKDGISPVVPMIRLGDNEVRVEGTALIDRDKLTGRLDTEETACLFIAMGKTRRSEISFKLPAELETQKKEGIVFIRRVHSKQKIKFEDGAPVIEFDIRLKAVLDEYSWGYNITDQSTESKVEAALTGSLETKLKDVFNKLQEADCDAIGIGDKLRAYHNGYWRAVGDLPGWKNVYPSMQSRFHVTADIIRYGEIK